MPTEKKFPNLGSNTVEQLLQRNQDGILIHRNGQILFCNPKLSKMVGAKKAEHLVGTSVLDLLSDSDRDAAEKYMKSTRSRRGQPTPELRLQRIDGELLSVELKSFPLMLQGNRVVVSMLRDIQWRKRLQARLSQSDRMETLGLLAAGVVHEINNPLTYLSLSLDELYQQMPARRDKLVELRQMLKRSIPARIWKHIEKDVEEQLAIQEIDEIIDSVEDAAVGTKRIEDIVKDLRMFSHLRESMDIICLNRTIQTAINLCRHRIQKKANLTIQLEKNLWIRADEGRLSQVLINLLVNAADAIPEGRRGNISLSMQGKDSEVWLEVKDDGLGMPLHVQKRLFDPFFTTKAPGVGTGLGLSISKRIIERFGGDMEFQSAEGEGSCFCLKFPLTAAKAREEFREQSTHQRKHRYRLLLIDDEDPIRRQLSRLLSEDFIVQTAACGRTALAMIREDSTYDLIVSDLIMPDGSGMDIYRWLEYQAPHLCKRLVYLTGGAYDEKMGSFLQSIPNIVMEKPIQPKAFLASLLKLVNAASDQALDGERRAGQRLKTKDLMGHLLLGSSKHDTRIIDFSESGFRMDGLPKDLPYSRHSHITLRLQNRKALGEIAAHIRFARFAERDPCFTIKAMSSRDKDLYNAWLSIA
jgi:PAS domain S-box-containing protein